MACLLDICLCCSNCICIIICTSWTWLPKNSFIFVLDKSDSLKSDNSPQAFVNDRFCYKIKEKLNSYNNSNSLPYSNMSPL